MITYLSGALVMGLLGNFHCLAMCGPLVLGMSSPERPALNALVYHLGRITVYAILGSAAGILGYVVSWAGFQQVVSLVLGSLLAIHGMLLFIGEGGLLSHAHLILPPSFVQKRMKTLWSSKKLSSRFGMGMLNGLLPCGLVYLALAASVTSHTMQEGAAFMMVFGLATLPVFAMLEVSKVKFKGKISAILPRVVPYLFVFFGLLLVLRGADLGIPFISPSISPSGGLGSCCSPK